ncbi:N-acylneuraminate cytidylyltransferase/CMP-N,N'-diacetyllegionaminic acid synthase [Christiangramia gaetbulicola]|uniref:N-acylneuraminate cytidylyltransferase/CMP-N,N'-diacetyllegionaminic acid synthase n=1 Tax=Christiangramia gaetbulicola TaxID=703340 RepID=A0A2T6AFP4_9FLAO|nr:acylneuraminate cytidylyltransferase family protein [Christiangramia gaetbulicola]PTX42609.1 N-acylneuraminate cytidylyltransferase/CMP-N,N'-diacetyllegionaminic acid synthase [Christiangramia gaetbulicola]
MIAIIPARGGSKGLPGKNIRLLDGKPLIAYTIEAAKNSKYISRLILSTDDPEIAAVGKQYGAEVPFLRPEYLASDTAKALDAYLYTIDKIFELEGLEITEFIVLQPTSPFRIGRHIDESIQMFNTKNADSVISFCEEQHPIVWHKYVDDEGKISSIFDERIRNRQDEKKTYFPNGAIFIFKKSILQQGQYYTENTYAYVMSRQSSIDIDTLEDFKYAEYLISKL